MIVLPRGYVITTICDRGLLLTCHYWDNRIRTFPSDFHGFVNPLG